MKCRIFLLLAITFFGYALIGCDRKPAENDSSAVNQDEQGIPRGKVTQYGLFNGLDKGRVEDSLNTSTGKIIRGSKVEFAESAERIPLRKDVYFGYRYWLKLPPYESRPRLKRVLIHPAMTLPDGSTVTRSERNITRKATHGIVSSLDVYALNEDYELVEGEWIFQLWYADKMLTEQKFTTYWPAETAAAGEAPETPGKKDTPDT